jgi:hypothetical protein
VETYLAYSMNGIHWQRCFHEPLFRNGLGNDPDAGCLQVSHLMTLEDGSLRAYAACSTNQHGICPPEDGHIVAYGLRQDGLVCLEARDAEGIVSTRALFWREGEGRLNVNARHGEIVARLIDARGQPMAGFGYDDCQPCNSDETAWSPRWSGGKTLAEMGGRMVRIELRMRKAQWYSLRGDFSIATLLDLQRWEQSGDTPARMPGF